jgi:predicted ABC-type transport system involved in lysophospholipase L1 biosynthesis ATPase subunit
MLMAIKMGENLSLFFQKKPRGDVNIKGSDKVIRLMLNFIHDFATTFMVVKLNEQSITHAHRLFELPSVELIEIKYA